MEGDLPQSFSVHTYFDAVASEGKTQPCMHVDVFPYDAIRPLTDEDWKNICTATQWSADWARSKRDSIQREGRAVKKEISEITGEKDAK